MNKNAIFIHAAILDKCTERVLQYLNIIQTSLLLDNIDIIYICFIGNCPIPMCDIDILKYNYNNKINLIKISENLSDYEVPTLNFLYKFCLQNLNYNVLYLHTKNVGKVINYCIEDRIECLLYFLVSKWEICIKKLDTFSACGVDLRTEPTLHFSGNFWWSTAKNVSQLPSPIEFSNLHNYPNPLNSERHNQEFWICYNKNNTPISLWDTTINVFQMHLHRYPKDLYVNL